MLAGARVAAVVLCTVLLAVWAAATSTAPLVIGSAVTATAAVVAATLTLIGNRRGSRDSTQLGIIHESQEALRADNIRLREDNADLREQVLAARLENAQLRADISGLRKQVAAMRGELADALAQHSECEQIRSTLELVVQELRRGGNE